MPETLEPTPTPRRSRSAAVKILVLGILALGLLVPVELILTLVREREARLHEVAREIATVWGGEQLVTGPVLSIPFRRRVEDTSGPTASQQEERWMRGEAIYLPEELHIVATVHPETRHRGIFSTAVYLADVAVSGTFRRPDPHALELDEADLRWEEAKLLITISDVHGLTRPVELDWPARAEAFEPTRRDSLPGVVLAASVDGLGGETQAEPLRFALELAARGSGELQFAPSARVTRVDVDSAWPDPGFSGSFLPAERSISEDGFSASWQVSAAARSFPQQWLETGGDSPPRESVLASGFGVRLTLPADAYHQTERSAKYAILFITLTFATFLLCELTSARQLHAMQYVLIGSALVVFYLLLLSLTEHFGFALSYLAAATATIALIAGYTRAILGGRRLALALLAWLGLLYGYLYVLLQLEDYALLAGSLGLFALLAAFMWLTRRLDWSSMELRRAV